MSALPRGSKRVVMRVPQAFKQLIEIWACDAKMSATDYIETVIMPSWKRVEE